MRWLLAAMTVILLIVTLNTCEAQAMQPLPLKVEKRATLTKIGESHDGEVTYWKLYDPKSYTVCFITVGELHGWTLSQTCLPVTKDGRAR
jgi:hypothetical protein